MNTRGSPNHKQSQKAKDTTKDAAENIASFRWYEATRKSLVATLLETPKLLKGTMTKEARYGRILSLLDANVFETKASMKWRSVENGWTTLLAKYREQSIRFRNTGEGPTEEEQELGAQNLFGIAYFVQTNI